MSRRLAMGATSPGTTAVLVARVVVALLGTAAPGTAQSSEYRMRAVHAHAHQTSVAVALRLPAGSQYDEEGRDGTAWLLGRVLETQAVRALARVGSEAAVTVSVERATTLVTVLAFPEDWRTAWRAVDSVLFEAPLDAAVVADQASALADRLAFESGSPVQDFATEAAGLLADPGSPYARPVRGTLATVPVLTPGDLDRYRRTHLRRALAVQAVVGPVPADTVAAPVPTDPASAGAGGLAWVTGDRRYQVQDVTSTWMVVAYPAPPGLPRTRLELIAHLLEEELDPTPPDPDRYSVAVRVEETPGGPVLLVEAAVFPEATARWEARITRALRRFADEPIPDDFFRWRRRRFRTARLLEEGAPEAEAARMTADLLRDGVVRDLSLEIWALDAAAVGEAARALGEPRIFILGPDLGGARPQEPGPPGRRPPAP